ncbi:fragile X mental retardation syndrome-related protein 1-like isoform X2 [Acyrthosiphon pisum]|uniref:Uncharacterized protein n=1 Tax=Acyrthosiphon pisum TaxID=7029 RepID=A0A8R2D7H2_ACYPI|nr:fragile X mental retardation syndrome-related protein 1-like isoform X2 [Acyrthosiphon pisum]XP_016665168.1 fragile X mental retardation syndrome-related protein 1-like isoform X2 [Acyrthosiphon pisum]|eukprot:XP_008189898.1 PREDICTED: fragile X mental retardation syndrome-related protein 1-like isoform X2 [Acyrthosiphon pisum]
MENEVLVSFSNDWFPETKFNYDNVRLPLSDDQCSTEFINNAKIDGIHKNLQTVIGASLVLFTPDQSVWSVISRSPLTVKKNIDVSLHFRNRNQNVMVRIKSGKLAKQQKIPCYSLHHHLILMNLMYVMTLWLWLLVLMALISNELAGLRNIDAVMKAREVAEYTKEFLQVPRNFMGKDFGINSSNIKDIIEKSGVNELKILRDDETQPAIPREDGQFPFVLKLEQIRK